MLVMSWFRRELAQHKLLTTGAVILAVVHSLLSNVALPYFVSQFLAQIVQSRGVPKMPIPLVWCALGAALAAPFRSFTVRRLEYLGRSHLTATIRNKVVSRTNQFSWSVIELDSATKTFLEAWSNFVMAAFLNGSPLIVGVCGMLALMAIKAPIMILLVVGAVAGAALMYAVAGREIVRTWGARTKHEHKEYEALDGVIANHAVHWLLLLAAKTHMSVAADWLKLARSHSRAVFRWQSTTNGLTNAMLIGAVAGSVWLANDQAADISTIFLLIWFTDTLGNHVQNLFFLSELFGSKLAEAGLLAEELDKSEQREVPPSIKVSRLATMGAAVRYEKPDSKTALSVSFPDMVFEPGLTILTGENGCGKSSLLRTVIGMQPYTGSVVLYTPDGDIEARDFDVRPLSVYSAQKIVLAGAATARSLFTGATQQEIEDALCWAAFPVETTLDRPLTEYSGGQQRALFNAAALHAATRTHLLMLDEPTNDLSRGNVRRMLAGLEAFMALHPNIIAIVVSHEPELLSRGYRTIEM